MEDISERILYISESVAPMVIEALGEDLKPISELVDNTYHSGPGMEVLGFTADGCKHWIIVKSAALPSGYMRIK